MNYGEMFSINDDSEADASTSRMMDTSSEKMSPVSSRSMKDYGTQISELKKENFSLKLRIFYMEERMQEQFTGDHEHVFRTNIELKVEAESLREELRNKQELLIKASNAVSTMEASNGSSSAQTQRELMQVKETLQERVQAADRELREVRMEADNLAGNVSDLQKYVQKLEEENNNLKQRSEASEMQSDAVTESEDVSEMDDPIPQEDSLATQNLENKERLIEQLRSSLQANQTVIEALNEEKASDQEKLNFYAENMEHLQQRNRELDLELAESRQQFLIIEAEFKELKNELQGSKQESDRMKTEYIHHISEQQQRLDEYEIAARQMSEELVKREEEVQDLSDALKESEETSKELVENLESWKKDSEMNKSKQLVMRDKAISGLTEVIRKREDEVSTLTGAVDEKEYKIKELVKSMELVEELNERNKRLESQNQELDDKLRRNDEVVRKMDEEMKERDKELQDLLTKYKDLLKKHEQEELARMKCMLDQGEMTAKFQREKAEFAELMTNMRDQYEDLTKNIEENQSLKNIQDLQERLFFLENQLKSKQAQLEEVTGLLKRAESDRKRTLEELEDAMKRRNDEWECEFDSQRRINSANLDEIERLRNQIRIKEDKLRDLEGDYVQLERSALEAEDLLKLSRSEVKRWKDEISRKDGIILELTRSLEELGTKSSNFDYGNLIKLTSENIDLKKILHEKESEIALLTSKQNQAEKDAEADVARSRDLKEEVSKLEKDKNAEVESLREDVENYKKELRNAMEMMNNLTTELENVQKQMMELQDACMVKDQIIAGFESMHELDAHRDSQEDFLHPVSEKEIQVNNSLFNLSNRSFGAQIGPPNLRESSNGGYRDVDTQYYSQMIFQNAGCQHPDVDVHKQPDLSESLEDLEKRKEYLRRLDENLVQERNMYREFMDSRNQSSDYPFQTLPSLRDQLRQIDVMAGRLRRLLLDVTGESFESSMGFNEFSHINQTSYLDIPNPPISSTHISESSGHLKLPELKESRRSHLKSGVNNWSQTSDNDLESICSNESEMIGTLSKEELREIIINLRKKLKNAENLNKLLKNQVETSPRKAQLASVDPDIIQRLSDEVERLKKQLYNAQEELKKSRKPDKLDSATDAPESKLVRKVNSSPNQRSKLPVPVGKISQSSLGKESDLRKQLDLSEKTCADLERQSKVLKCKLSATEETVRQQAEKLRRSQGGHPNSRGVSPVRSALSQPNLVFDDFPLSSGIVRQFSNETLNAHTQTSADDTGYSTALPEEKFNSLIQSQAKELSGLRQKLKKSRYICGELQKEFILVLRYIKNLLRTTDYPDATLASSVTTELERCKNLSKKLKRHLTTEWTSEGTMSESDSDDSWTEPLPTSTRPPSSELRKKNQELEEKNMKILALEKKLQSLLHEKQDTNTQTSQGRWPGLLTPTSSRHSMFSTEDDTLAPFLRSSVSMNTEYVPIAERIAPPTRPMQQKWRAPMYQRTIAVTEYLPPSYAPAEDERESSSRHRLPTCSDAENCTASYGGSWNPFSSRNQQLENTIVNDANDVVGKQDADDLLQLNKDLQEKLEESDNLNQSLREELDFTLGSIVSRHPTERSRTDILDEHLNEIRALRKHLEESIRANAKLREELNQKLKEATDATPSEYVFNNIYPGQQEDRRLEEEVEGLRRDVTNYKDENGKLKRQLDTKMLLEENYKAAAKELEALRCKTSDGYTQTDVTGNEMIKERESFNQHLMERDAEVAELRKKIEYYKTEENEMRKQLRLLESTTSRLRNDMNRIRDELDESNDLTRSLKSELSLYEKFHKNTDSTTSIPPQLSEILAEIKMLRAQLEESIEVNVALRKQLQEQLQYAKDGCSKSPKTTTINIHHFSPGSPDRRSSKSSTSDLENTIKLNLNDSGKLNDFLMTPPPSACEEDHLEKEEFRFFSTQTTPREEARFSGMGSTQTVEEPNWPHHSFFGPYILGKLMDFNQLKRIITDCRLLARGILAKLGSKRTSSLIMNPDDIMKNIRLLQTKLEESGTLMKMFWPASIPPGSDGGKQGSQSILKKHRSSVKDAGTDSSNLDAENLRREINKLNKKLSAQDRELSTYHSTYH